MWEIMCKVECVKGKRRRHLDELLRVNIPTKPAKTVPTVAAIIVDVRMDEDVAVVDISRAAIGLSDEGS